MTNQRTPSDVRRFTFLPRQICFITSFEHYKNDKSEGIFGKISSIRYVSSYGHGLGLVLLSTVGERPKP